MQDRVTVTEGTETMSVGWAGLGVGETFEVADFYGSRQTLLIQVCQQVNTETFHWNGNTPDVMIVSISLAGQSLCEFNTAAPTNAPLRTMQPTASAIAATAESNVPTAGTSNPPSHRPSSHPPTSHPTLHPTRSLAPSKLPSSYPSSRPTRSSLPSMVPSKSPTRLPSINPTETPSSTPSQSPSLYPTVSQAPSRSPSRYPSSRPSLSLSPTLSMQPSTFPTVFPSVRPSQVPTRTPTVSPSRDPTFTPTTSSPSMRRDESSFPSVVAPTGTSNIFGRDVSGSSSLVDSSLFAPKHYSQELERPAAAAKKRSFAPDDKNRLDKLLKG
jgi:hypothetical protein